MKTTLTPHSTRMPYPPGTETLPAGAREDRRRSSASPRILAGLALLFLLSPAAASGYIGPGAGFALLSSFLVVLITAVIALLSALLWPFRATWRRLRRGKPPRPWIRRLVVVGFDGQEPKLTERLMGEGKLPNFARLAAVGCYSRLGTTFPSVSPVAWSSFSTGTHPAKHNIFDFLARDPRTYLPVLSSTHVGRVERTLKIGRLRIPLHRPELRLLRKSKAFWSILGEHGIWSTVLRVPITFPPERFYGAQLSAMCVPDLLGTQGTFLYYTTRPATAGFKEGGLRVQLAGGGPRFETSITGPENTFLEGGPPLEIPLVIDADRAARRVRVSFDRSVVELEPGKLSEWVRLTFPVVPGIKASGICRMMVTELDEHLSLYLTPINLDPERPAMPISHPSYYATYLAKKIGPYATLGLAEDTWGLNEKVVSDDTFLQLTYDIEGEREAMFFAALDRLRRGSLVCVFDATDRIQHMFWRYTDDGHPAQGGATSSAHHDAIEDLYVHNDALLGKVLDRLAGDDVLIVLSDHGFTSFRRGVNLNGWLLANGYLALKEGASGAREWLRDVDWSRTRAYALGLTGMFLNVRGREAEGVVEPGADAAALKAELIERLSGLRDEQPGEVAITELFDTARLYSGPYLANAPDMLVGFNHGYRVSWDCATGMVSGPVFADNPKAWSGDHCVDPRLVPGVFFCNREIDLRDPTLLDIAPTALRLFGLTPPPHMDGHSLFSDRESLRSRAGEPGRASESPEGR
jgi:predicted AlkP superfamily phosphohydrolase/phosphomutase